MRTHFCRRGPTPTASTRALELPNRLRICFYSRYADAEKADSTGMSKGPALPGHNPPESWTQAGDRQHQ